jgi:hypothetical protein
MQVRTNPPKAQTVSITIIAVAVAMGMFYYQGSSEYVVWTLLSAYLILLLGSLYKGI